MCCHTAGRRSRRTQLGLDQRSAQLSGVSRRSLAPLGFQQRNAGKNITESARSDSIKLTALAERH
jgi:hypothetical protein